MTAAQAEQFSYLVWQQVTDPPYYVNSTAISADGGCVVAGTFNHAYLPQAGATPPPPSTEPNKYGTYCFDATGKQLWVDQFQGYEGVYAVGISADGSTAASGGWYSSSPFQGFIRAYNVAEGSAPLFDFRLGERVNSLALSSNGSTLVAGSDKVYLFQQTDGKFPSQPAELDLVAPPPGQTVPNNVQAVAITGDGGWIVAGDYYGNVYYVQNNNGSFAKPFVWSNSSMTRLHTIAMTCDGKWLAAAGSDSTVYLFSPDSMTMGPPTTMGSYTLDTGGRVGWIAITDDGSLLSAVGNTGKTGSVVVISNESGTLTRKWEQPTAHNPNSTSIDSAGKFVTVADGYPDGQPGSFSLYDAATGNSIWTYPTTNMNWPMFISSDGSGIIAGSDNGNVYYFKTTN